jgi:hypothetical protein
MVHGDQPCLSSVYSRLDPIFAIPARPLHDRNDAGAWSRLLEISLKTSKLFAAILPLLLTLSPARSETREQWIEWGARIHGGFGAFIPVGIRIGLDARERLKADARGLTVTYYSGEKPPCPCVADGIMIATQASLGQGTLQMAPEKAPQGSMTVIRHSQPQDR